MIPVQVKQMVVPPLTRQPELAGKFLLILGGNKMKYAEAEADWAA